MFQTLSNILDIEINDYSLGRPLTYLLLTSSATLNLDALAST